MSGPRDANVKVFKLGDSGLHSPNEVWLWMRDRIYATGIDA